MFGLATVDVDGTKITPATIEQHGQLPRVEVTVIAANGTKVRRKRTFKGEMAHLDAGRYVDDVALELRIAARSTW